MSVVDRILELKHLKKNQYKQAEKDLLAHLQLIQEAFQDKIVAQENVIKAMAERDKEKFQVVREAFKQYVKTEVSGYCFNYEEHKKAKDTLGRLLDFKRYSDDSGYDICENDND